MWTTISLANLKICHVFPTQLLTEFHCDPPCDLGLEPWLDEVGDLFGCYEVTDQPVSVSLGEEVTGQAGRVWSLSIFWVCLWKHWFARMAYQWPLFFGLLLCFYSSVQATFVANILRLQYAIFKGPIGWGGRRRKTCKNTKIKLLLKW